ncbi:Arrestin C-terminal-like domain-containing protein [Caenorhabditis elegans]|uniref:Arrestin C-terminal-like domain-containing protein n=1 Tax=Caenorhabditis elegans TaxID=6239 RepID=Q9XXI0_CAEEL|nr:Arrestin C-terminal-like domain-containing protein [Caenorhabditis elegans]CAA19461.1 Arrestin C-terminal-like domain-containing protein [Caenorhabditis elegans]|eukprot:NP_496568.1 ARRestin Domain protein [Caenorhabditis elegans]
MGDTTFLIEFDHPAAVYSPGQNVAGKLTIRNRNALNALALKICIHGDIETLWRKFENKGRYDRHGRWYRSSEHINYTSKINVLEGIAQPWSSIENANNKIPGGVNIFPFLFQLPANLPPSFEGTHGNVRYSVHVELDRPWRMNVEAKRVFSVIPVIDLNSIPKTINPMIVSSCKHSGLFSNKEVKVKISIPKSGYIPGETIQVSALIQNHTKKPIYSIKAKLEQHVHYQAQQENSHLFPEEHCHKHCEHKTAQTTMSKVEKSCHVEFCSNSQINVPLVLPNQLVPSFRTGIIEVDYCIIVDIGENKKLRCELPITVGTIPIGVFTRPIAYSITEAPPKYENFSQIVEDSQASAPPPEYENEEHF